MKKQLSKLALTAALALAITLTFTACEEKEAAKAPAPEVAKAEPPAPTLAPADSKGSSNVKLLESITDDKGNPEKKFEYDGQSRIVKIYEYSDGKLDNTQTITYISDDKVKVDETDYVKKGNTITYKYANGSIATLTINKEGFVVEEDSWIYKYNDGNLIKMEDKELGYQFYTEYNKYDNKKSPFSGSNTPKWLLFKLCRDKCLSKNNVIEYINVGDCGNGSDKCEYEYDSDGFPTKQTCKTSSEAFCEDEENTVTTSETTSTKHFKYLGSK